MSKPPKNESKVRMRDVHLAFGISLDEEYVALHATCDGTVHDVTSRMPKYDLLVLARKRLADAASGLLNEVHRLSHTGGLVTRDGPSAPLDPRTALRPATRTTMDRAA
jgi:hypothetical protein